MSCRHDNVRFDEPTGANVSLIRISFVRNEEFADRLIESAGFFGISQMGTRHGIYPPAGCAVEQPLYVFLPFRGLSQSSRFVCKQVVLPEVADQLHRETPYAALSGPKLLQLVLPTL